MAQGRHSERSVDLRKVHKVGKTALKIIHINDSNKNYRVHKLMDQHHLAVRKAIVAVTTSHSAVLPLKDPIVVDSVVKAHTSMDSVVKTHTCTPHNDTKCLTGCLGERSRVGIKVIEDCVVETVNSMLVDLFESIIKEAAEITHDRGLGVIGTRELKHATERVLEGDLLEECLQRGFAELTQSTSLSLPR